MSLSRRAILKAGLGAAQLALLHQSGVRAAAAQRSGGPTKLVTIYVPGGWMPIYMFCPLTGAEISRVIPAAMPHGPERDPVFFDPSHVENLDGSGAATDGPRARLRVVKLWDEAALLAGKPGAAGTAPHGWSWRMHRLWEHVSVVHGVDMGSAAHESARVSAMCGVAGDQYRSPALHALFANGVYDRFKDSRPLACVSIEPAPVPNPLGLRPEVGPISLRSLDGLGERLSDRVGAGAPSDSAWRGLRGRRLQDVPHFRGGSSTQEPVTDREAFVLEQYRLLQGTTNARTDAFFEQLFDAYVGVSRVLARDVVDVLQKTKGVEKLTRPPAWVPQTWGPFGVDIGGGVTSDAGATWHSQFDLTLRLLKSDLVSAVSVNCPGSGGFYFDTHSGLPGHTQHFSYLRAVFDVIGRFLAELKLTPGTSGGTLLDETLVVVFSEFGRTWPKGGTCDHWPANSVILAGGGLVPNRGIGSYDIAAAPADAIGFPGTPVAIREEHGAVVQRAPKSADVVHTVLHQLGVDRFSIPGGSGAIADLRA